MVIVGVESEKIEIFSPPTFSGRSFMVQHLLHIQNLVTPEICYNTRRFRRLISLLGASGSGFGIFLPPPIHAVERGAVFHQLLSFLSHCHRI